LPFNGHGWFRLHIYIDSAVNLKNVIGLRISQTGASDLYLDGKRISRFGEVNSKDSIIYHDPAYLPVALPISAYGPHLIAIRYANYRSFDKSGFEGTRGFRVNIGPVNYMFQEVFVSLRLFGYGLLILAGIFTALSLIHIFLFLYNREELSNAFFSAFAISVAVLLSSVYVFASSLDSIHQVVARYAMVCSLVAASYSLSGFNNIFSRSGRLRLRIVGLVCLLIIILWWPEKTLAAGATGILFLFVLIETIILNIKAIYKKYRERVLSASDYFFLLLSFFPVSRRSQ
jgi:adenylate cyclase